MPSFNLVEEPWIPCVTVQGEAKELGLRDTLISAHSVRELFDPSPIVTVALHRLLLAILHRNFGPETFDAWKILWQKGSWDAGKLNEYFDNWRYRFDLFDSERPFFQVPRLKKVGKKRPNNGDRLVDVAVHPISLLMQESASGNNPTLFDHSFAESPAALSPGHAARYLVARQAYSVGFGVSQPFNLSDSTLIRGYSVLVTGETLFETLALNLILYNQESPFQRSREADLLLWEQDQPAEPKKNGTPVRGYLDYLTWQSRRIHLLSDEAGTSVSHCQLLQNLKLPLPSPRDPFKCYVISKIEGMRPRSIDPERALWRDSHALFQTGDTSKRPEIFNHLAQIERSRRSGEIDVRPAYAFSVYGLATEIGKAASVILWSSERLPLPLVYLDDSALVEALNRALVLCEEVSSVLSWGVRRLSRYLLSPDSGKPDGRRPDEKKDVASVARRLGAIEHYWSSLEAPFRRLLFELPPDKIEEAETIYGVNELPRWARTLRNTALNAFSTAARSLDISSRSLKAVAKAEPAFRGKLRDALSDYLESFPATGGER